MNRLINLGRSKKRIRVGNTADEQGYAQKSWFNGLDKKIYTLFLLYLFIGGCWTTAYYISINILPDFSETVVLGYLVAISVICSTLLFFFIFMTFVLPREAFKHLAEHEISFERGKLLYLILIFVVLVCGVFAVRFDSHLNFNGKYIVLAVCIVYVFLGFINRTLTAYLNAFFMLLLTAFFYIYLVVICSLYSRDSAALFSIILLIHALILLGLIDIKIDFIELIIKASIFYLVVILICISFSTEFKFLNTFLSIPFKRLSLGNFDIVLVFDKESPNYLKLNGVYCPDVDTNAYEFHIISSIGSEYIVRRIDGDSNSPVIRIPKDRVKAVVYNYSKPKKGNVPAKTAKPSLLQ